LIAFILIANGGFKYYTVSHNISNTSSVSENWKEELQKELDGNKAQLKQMENGLNGIGAKEMLWTGSKILYIPAVLKTLTVFGLDFLFKP